MPYGYDKLVETMLKEYSEIDNDPIINSVLDYTLSNSGTPTDSDAWVNGTERFIKDNLDTLRAWDVMAICCRKYTT